MQYLDQGIIDNLKSNYRHEYALDHLIPALNVGKKLAYQQTETFVTNKAIIKFISQLKLISLLGCLVKCHDYSCLTNCICDIGVYR